MRDVGTEEGAIDGAHPRWILTDFECEAQHRTHSREYLVNRILLSAAEIDGLAGDARGVCVECSRGEAPGGVQNVDVVALGPGVSEIDGRSSLTQLGDDRRQQVRVGLARADHVEKAD